MKTIKTDLRRHFLTEREALSAEWTRQWSSSICTHILESHFYQSADTILAYMPIRNEVDIRGILEQSLKDKKALYLPKVHGKEMRFYQVKDLQMLHPGAYGILEPEEILPLDVPKGLMLVPGVAFSKNGFRIGYGGGFYDRYLCEKNQIVTVGVCYEQQICSQLTPEVFDQPVDELVTECGWLKGRE